jgi:hypothetical protein
MFFSRRAAASAPPTRSDELCERLLPTCYDEFRGTKIYNIIEHPKPVGDRIYLSVQYAGSAAVKARGARWDPDKRRWWYWSNSTEQLAHYYDIEAWLGALQQVHSRSRFVDWPMDVDFMRATKSESLSCDDFFHYSNPNPCAAVVDDRGNPASDARAK